MLFHTSVDVRRILPTACATASASAKSIRHHTCKVPRPPFHALLDAYLFHPVTTEKTVHFFQTFSLSSFLLRSSAPPTSTSTTFTRGVAWRDVEWRRHGPSNKIK